MILQQQYYQTAYLGLAREPKPNQRMNNSIQVIKLYSAKPVEISVFNEKIFSPKFCVYHCKQTAAVPKKSQENPSLR